MTSSHSPIYTLLLLCIKFTLTKAADNDTPMKGYVPPPSIGHELGVMFGFIALMCLMMFAYGIAWQMGNKKSAQKELARRQALTDRGFGGEKMPVDNNNTIRAARAANTTEKVARHVGEEGDRGY